MERVLSTQLIVGLTSFSHGSPRITFSFPRLRTWKVIWWAIQALGREFVFPNEPPVNAGDTCPAVYEGSGVNGFHRVRRCDELNWDLHSR